MFLHINMFGILFSQIVVWCRFFQIKVVNEELRIHDDTLTYTVSRLHRRSPDYEVVFP